MPVVSFSDLQALSGYKHRNKVIQWCREQGIRFVLNSSNQPVTVSDMLREDLDGTRETTTLRFE